MNNMKFRVSDTEESKRIQQALFAAGFEWVAGARVHYTDAKFLYADTLYGPNRRISFGNDDAVFDASEAVEHFVLDGTLVPSLRGQKPPLGLRPRSTVCEQRIDEIYAAINRYSAAKVMIPLEWIEELAALNEEAKSHG